jgi:hypothetical protein
LFNIAIQGVSLYLIGSSPLFFSFLLQSPSYGGFNRSENSLFILI